MHQLNQLNQVSIPFKRESVSKVKEGILTEDPNKVLSFNSLQTGKCIQRKFASHRSEMRLLFQFPSNGKVYPKFLMAATTIALTPKFQFPSNGKVYPKDQFSDNARLLNLSFNSLQTGKCIQRCDQTVAHNDKTIVFQFPSNGKVYPKSLYQPE